MFWERDGTMMQRIRTLAARFSLIRQGLERLSVRRCEGKNLNIHTDLIRTGLSVRKFSFLELSPIES